MRTIALVCLTALSSCATVNFDPNKPLVDDGVFKQDGKIVDRSELRRKLKDNPEAFDYAQKSQIFELVGMVAGGVGGFIIGLTAGSASSQSDKKDVAGLYVAGGALTVGGFVCSLIGSHYLKKAADVHNGKFNEKANATNGGRFNLTPYANFGRMKNEAGISMSF